MTTIRLRWNLSPKQRALFESPARIRVGMMGRRAGKNEVATAALIDYATQPNQYAFGTDSPDPLCWWVGPTYHQAYEYGYLKTLEKLPDVLVGPTKETPPYEIKLTPGARIQFYSFDNPKGLQGAGVDFMVVDEAAYMPETIWDNDLRPMLLDRAGGALLISKPIGENWFHTLYEFGQDPDEPSYDSIHATSYENPFIPDEEVDEAKRRTPEPVFRQQYLADPQAGGTILTRDQLSFIPAETIRDRELSFHVGVDLGIEPDAEKAREHDTDYWAAIIVGHDPLHQKAYLLDVQRTRGVSKDQAAEWLVSIMDGVPTRRVLIEANQAQVFFVQEAQQRGLNVVPIENRAAKEDRIMYLSVPAKNDRFALVNHVPKEEWPVGASFDPRWEPFVKEWVGFPAGKHDDVLDVTEMVLRRLDLGVSTFVESGSAYGEA